MRTAISSLSCTACVALTLAACTSSDTARPIDGGGPVDGPVDAPVAPASDADTVGDLRVDARVVVDATPPPDVVPPVCAATPPAAQVTVVINEVMVENVYTSLDSNGAWSDWIELYNYGTTEVSMCGVGITNDLANPNRGYLSEDAIIAPGGHLVVWFSSAPLPFDEHAPVTLPKAGGEIGLTHPDGTYIARLAYGAQATDFSAAREPDGSDNWVTEWHPSPGTANPSGGGQPVAPHDAAAPPEHIAAVGDLTERILGYDAALVLGLRIAAAEMAELRAAPRTWVPGYLVYDGREYGPVGIKLKGANSFQPIDAKPSFRINIDEYIDHARFFELDDLTLNNMSDDYSMMHERLAYWVARRVGPASRANHAQVLVNNQHYGLYSNVETVKHHMMARWFADSTGPLFEATDVDFTTDYIDDYERESGADDRSALTALADALRIADPDDAMAAAAAHLDLDGFISFWAMEAVLGQFDAFPYSNPGDDYFVYADPTSGRLWFVPWGMDETFYSGDVDVTEVRSVLATTCWASASCRQAFVARVWQVYDLTQSMGLEAERQRVSAQTAPLVLMDTRKPYTNAIVDEYRNHLRWFIKGRRDALESYLGPRAP